MARMAAAPASGGAGRGARVTVTGGGGGGGLGAPAPAGTKDAVHQLVMAAIAKTHVCFDWVNGAEDTPCSQNRTEQKSRYLHTH